MKILLIEDDPGDRKLFQDALKETGMECGLITAVSANESIDLIFHEKPDLIVMDIKLIGISGADFALLMQKNLSTKFLPIIFLTGTSDVFMDSPGEMEIGEQRYRVLFKPPEPHVLKEAILKVYKPRTPLG